MHSRVLLVDDDHDLCEAIIEALGPRGFSFEWKPSAEAALEAMHDADWDVVVTDISMDGMSGLALCERVVANHPNLPVVLMTGFGSMETAVGAVRAGAYDFVTKPFETNVLALALERAVRHRRLHDDVKPPREPVVKAVKIDGLIGDSPQMRGVFELIDRVAETDATVLITGQSGTGKELVARAIHQRGRRASAPFVAINCAALPEPRLESDLFGDVTAGPAAAGIDRRGLLMRAHGGTVFLDEIAEMPIGTQWKLLHVLRDRTVRAVGGDDDEPYDARLITATKREIEPDVAGKRFSVDLFYRINVIRIDMPPLAARGRDVLLLAQHFLARAAAQLQRPACGLSIGAAEKLLAYRWPGNVRELKSCIGHALATARGDELTVDDLPEIIRDYRTSDAPAPVVNAAAALTLEEVEHRHIVHVLRSVGGNKSAAAAVLGMHLSTLYRKLDHYGVVDLGTPRPKSD